MQKQNEIIDLYLKMDTNYALLITGEWGVGKTYYFKNTLTKKISETNVYSNNEKKYKPILISLFGIKSIEEIQTEIFLSLYPILKKTAVKLAANVGKALIKGYMHLKGAGVYSKFVDEINVNKKNLIDFEELVICFDDLERKSENLQIEEFIGFINTLVESENVKVLIIANEGKIEAEKYKVLKEKVIGNSIEFIPDINEVFDSILSEKYSAFKSYKSFLKENKKFILEIFEKKSTNLRVLIFALSYYHKIYSEIENRIFKEPQLSKIKLEVIQNLLKFSIAISIGYREGKLSYKERHELNAGLDLDFKLFSGVIKTDKDKDKSIRAQFLETYYQNDRYCFYKSVYEYLTGGTDLNYTELLEEIKNLYHINKNKVLPQYDVYNKLGYRECILLSDKEYLKLTKQLLSYTYKGSYDIQDYLSVFYLATRFQNPLNLNFDQLEKAIIRGLKKGKSHYEYKDSLDFYLTVDKNSENLDYVLRIRQVILDLNKENQSKLKSKMSKRFEKLCYQGFEEFYEQVLDSKQSYFYEPVFAEFNSDKFYSFFYQSTPKNRWQIVKLFARRYEHISPSCKPEVQFLKKFRDKVEKKMNYLLSKNVQGYVYSELNRHLQSAIIRLENTQS